MKNKITRLTTITAGLAIAFTGCSDPASEGTNAAAGGNGTESAVPNSFAAVTAKLDKGGDVFLYYSTEQVIATVEQYANSATEAVQGFAPGPMEQEMVDSASKAGDAFLDQSGLRDINGVGMSSLEYETGMFRNKVVVHHDEAKAGGKLWSLIGSEPHDFSILKLLPADTAIAFSHEIHPKALLDWVPDLLEASDAPPQFKGQFDNTLQMANGLFGLKDLLASFDNEIGLFVSLDESETLQLPPGAAPPGLDELPMPSMAIMAKVKDDKLSDFVLAALRQAGGPDMEKRTVAGIEMLVITEPAPLPVPLAPAFFRLGDFFVIANTEDLAKRIVAIHNGDEKGLADTEEYKRLAKGLNLKGSHFFYAGNKIGETMSPIIQQAMQADGMPEGFLGLDFGNAYDMQTLGVVRVDKNGITVENHSQKGIFNSVMMQAGVIPVSVGAGMLLPSLANAKAKAQRISCVNNMKQISIALRIYATDNEDRYPWQVPQAEGGTAELTRPKSDTNALLDADGKPIFDANTWLHFQALSNELSNPKILRCPSDTRPTLTQANTFGSKKPERGRPGRRIIPFDENSVSYWLRTDPEVDESKPNEIVLVCSYHNGQYNVLLADGSVQQCSWNRLRQYFLDINNPITLPRFPPPSLR